MDGNRKRCPNGTRKNKQGDCVEKSNASTTKRNRCPSGTRRNKEGNCVGSDGQPYVPRIRTTPPSKENIVIMTAANLKKQHNIKMYKAAVHRAVEILISNAEDDSRVKFLQLTETLFEKAIEIAKESGKKIVTVAHVESASKSVFV